MNGNDDGTNHGIIVQDWDNVTVTGNVVSSVMGTGIDIKWYSLGGGGVDNVIVSNNVVFNCGKCDSANDKQRNGIGIEGGTSDQVRNVGIYNNRCYDNQASGTQKYGIRVQNAQDCIIKNNDVRGNAVSGINVVTSNKYRGVW